MKNSINSLVSNFKNHLKEKENITLDFRTHVYLKNDYGLTPCFEYHTAEKIIIALYDWAHKYIDNNEENHPDFNGFQYNLMMECDKLRISSLKDLVLDICNRISIFYK